MDNKRTRWVLFHGGPSDGVMAELPWSFSPDQNTGLKVHGPDVPDEDGSLRMGPREGV